MQQQGVLLDNNGCNISSNGYKSDDSSSNTSTNSVSTNNLVGDGLAPLDVICARSRRASAHSGNQTYQALIRNNRSMYQSAKARQEKNAITRSIIHSIQNEGGRFVSLNKSKSLWEELDPTSIHEKVAHALRSGSEEKKQQKKVYRKLRAASARQRDEATATTAIFNFDPILQQQQQQKQQKQQNQKQSSQCAVHKLDDILLTKPMNMIGVPSSEVPLDTGVTPTEGLQFDEQNREHEAQTLSESYSRKRNSGTLLMYPSLNDSLFQSLDNFGVDVMEELAGWGTHDAEINL